MPNGNTTRVIWQYKENHQIVLIDRKHFANGIPVYQISYSGPWLLIFFLILLYWSLYIKLVYKTYDEICVKIKNVFSYIKEMYLWLNNIHLLFGHYELKTLIEIIKIKSQLLFELFKTDKDGLKYVLLPKKDFKIFIYLFTYIHIYT